VVSVERCKLFVSTSVTKFNTVFLLCKYICMKNEYFAKQNIFIIKYTVS